MKEKKVSCLKELSQPETANSKTVNCVIFVKW
jgi:hypothetical protein